MAPPAVGLAAKLNLWPFDL